MENIKRSIYIKKTNNNPKISDFQKAFSSIILIGNEMKIFNKYNPISYRKLHDGYYEIYINLVCHISSQNLVYLNRLFQEKCKDFI